MTIMVGFHLSGYRTFKHYYLNDVLRYQRGYFPGLVSYHRFVELLQSVWYLCAVLLFSNQPLWTLQWDQLH
jgi:hypothetical protein